MKEEYVKRVYDGAAYDEAMATTYKDLIDRPYLFSLLPKTGKGLEVCCGTGLNFPFYPQEGIELVAVDFHKGMLDVAHQRADDFNGQGQGGHISVETMDAGLMNFPDRHFDFSMETLGLCVAPNPRQILQEMSRVTKPGGLVVVFDMCLSPNPSMALAQQLMIQHTSMTGFPEGVIVWDPTIDLDKLAEGLPLTLLRKELHDADSPWCRGYFVWQKN